jgi:hypothetical protein
MKVSMVTKKQTRPPKALRRAVKTTAPQNFYLVTYREVPSPSAFQPSYRNNINAH